MRFLRKTKKPIDLETLVEVPTPLRFDLFHRPKDIVGSAIENRTSIVPIANKGHPCSDSNRRPKVNLFPQISLTDVRDKDLDNVVNYMYSSDWKEAAAFCAQASCIDLRDCDRARAAQRNDVTDTFPDRFRKRSLKKAYFDLPRAEVNLAKWYKSVVG
ncbi:uncharacterized protein LOC134215957 [Armigeres subalbatus]|uniref:uncharacterized protein LOC134215957 n=1 Tax=Armigeres subalbatus TaxID=124917 RepID=UPI002ED0C9B8